MAGHPRRAFIAVLALVLAHYFLVTGGSPGDAASGAGHPAWRCARPTHGFIPSKAQIPAIARTVKVIQVKRQSNGQIGAGPTTEAGKWLMSMDPKTHPGGHKGSVLLAGHTWPDGSALGNAMLENLWTGNGIVLLDDNGHKACYRVNRRKSYPSNAVPSSAFRASGPEQVVIVSCSGKRLGPGNWTRRTLWYATPWTPAKKKPSSPPPSSPSPSNGTLVGGLLSGL